MDGAYPASIYDAGGKYDDGIRFWKRSNRHGSGTGKSSGGLVCLLFCRNALGGLCAGRLLHRDIRCGGQKAGNQSGCKTGQEDLEQAKGI